MNNEARKHILAAQTKLQAGDLKGAAQSALTAREATSRSFSDRTYRIACEVTERISRAALAIASAPGDSLLHLGARDHAMAIGISKTAFTVRCWGHVSGSRTNLSWEDAAQLVLWEAIEDLK